MSARRLVAGALAALAAAGAGLAVPAAAQAPLPESRFLIASRDDVGYVSVAAFALTPGSTAEIAERTADGPVVLRRLTVGDDGAVLLPKFVRWRCDRPVRRFAALVTAPDGTQKYATTDILTPSCATRVALSAPEKVTKGRLATVRIVDRWGLGDRNVQFCAGGAGVDRSCRNIHLVRGVKGVTRRLRPDRDGYLKLGVALAGTTERVEVAVGDRRVRPARSGPALLATGDSTIEGIDSGLEDRYAGSARVSAESRPGTRLSGSGESFWRKESAAQVARVRPRVTVLSIGGNEGYPIDGVECCGDAWIAGLAERQGRLADTYRRGRKGNVIWLTIPVPRTEAQARIVAAVDAAIVSAASTRPWLKVLDLGAIFTPDGQYHDTQRRSGRDVQVRAPDGLHLSAAGQQIAADAVAALITRDGLLD